MEHWARGQGGSTRRWTQERDDNITQAAEGYDYGFNYGYCCSNDLGDGTGPGEKGERGEERAHGDRGAGDTGGLNDAHHDNDDNAERDPGRGVCNEHRGGGLGCPLTRVSQ